MDSDQIKALREGFQMNQTSFARLLNVDLRSVGNWENKRSTPSATAEAMLIGLNEAVRKGTIDMDSVQAASRVGGLSYLLILLFDKTCQD